MSVLKSVLGAICVVRSATLCIVVNWATGKEFESNCNQNRSNE